MVRAVASLVVCALFGSSSCSKAEPAPDPTPFWERAQADPTLENGRQIWRQNCRRCHAHGVEGAPRIGDVEAWKSRAEKGVDELTANALTGVAGKAGGEMPARGGNEKLTDAQVRSAVLFMLAALEGDGAREARR
jgi:cytochrome c5